MRWLAALIVSLLAVQTQAAGPKGVCSADSVGPNNAYSMTVTDVDGKKVDLGSYRGKVTMIVNTASKCGYTDQYADLQGLYAKYRDQGFAVLGFPSNDFGGQEPGSNAEIKSFCLLNYKVGFPLFSKAPVKGDAKQPLYKWLTENSGEKYKGEISWNFEKFVIDKGGNVVGRFKSGVKPLSKEITQVVEAAIAKKASECQ